MNTAGGSTRLRRAEREDFPRIVEIAYSAYAPHDPDGRLIERHPTELSGRPFCWFGEPSTSWWIAESEGAAAGYALWRHVGRNVHLHALFVDGVAQRRGIGTALIEHHFQEAVAESPRLESFTLHVQREAHWARRFYAAHGYSERDPRTLVVGEDSGLGDWARAYEAHGWVSREKLLMVRAREP